MGDVLNILLIINKTFFKNAYRIFNPRNAMYVNRNDGYFNSAVCVERDTLINANTMVRMGRDTYSIEERKLLEKIRDKARHNYQM